MHDVHLKLFPLLLALLRLPFDLLFLGYDFLRLSFWLGVLRPLHCYRYPSEPHPAPMACLLSESVLDQEEYAQLCGPARKYGSPWLYSLLCRWCTVRGAPGLKGSCAVCQNPTEFTLSPWRHALVGVALLALYSAAGGACWWATRPSARTHPVQPPVAASPVERPTEEAQKRQQVADQVRAARELRAAGKGEEARLAFRDAVALDESSVEAQAGLAECAYELHLYPEAEQASEHALRLGADSAPARLTAARTAKVLGKVDVATEHARKALTLSPDDVDAMLLLSTCHLAAGRHDEAKTQAQAAVALAPQNPSAILVLADVELAGQNPTEAEKHYRRALELDPQLLNARVGLARILRLRGERSAAGGMLQDILANTPDATNAALELAEVNVAEGKLRAAIDVLRGLREKQPRLYLARARLAQLLVQSGKTNAGYIVAQELLADDPGNAAAHIILAETFLRNGFPTLASEHCRAVLTQNAGLVVAIKLLTRACLAAEEYGDGSLAIRRLVDQRPMDLEAKVLLAFCYEGMGAKDKSTALMEAAATAFPDSPVPLVELGTIYRRRGDQAAAATAYGRALARAPEDPVVLHSNAALILDSSGDKDRALELALKAAKLLPANPAVADTLGWAYCQRGEFDRAMERLVYAAMQMRDEPAVRYHLAVALYGKGETAKARDQLKQALAMDQGFPAAAQATALLEKITAEDGSVPALLAP